MAVKKVEGKELLNHVAKVVGVGFVVISSFGFYEGDATYYEPKDFEVQFKALGVKHDSLTYIDSRYVSSNSNDDTEPEQMEVVAGYILIDGDRSSILDSDGCSSFTDSGSHNLSVNFMESLDDYRFAIMASDPELTVSASRQDNNQLELSFNRPYVGIIHIIFYQLA